MNLLPIEIKNIILEYIFFTPKDKNDLKDAVETWICDKMYAFEKYGHISGWNTRFITNMDYLFNFNIHHFIKKSNIKKYFRNHSSKYYIIPRNHFNENINNWDVSNVVSMKKMFYECTEFNQPIDKWNVSKVKNMKYMFYDASTFNQNLNSWNVSYTSNMDNIFTHADSFDKKNALWYNFN